MSPPSIFINEFRLNSKIGFFFKKKEYHSYRHYAFLLTLVKGWPKHSIKIKKKKQFRELTGRKTTLTAQLGFNL